MVLTDQQRLSELCRKYGIRKLSVFGSTVRGEQTTESDIDLLVEFDPDRHLSLIERESLDVEMSALFGGRRVDLVNRKYLNRHMAPMILAEAELQYAEG
ncbi:MAG TPA: nucleotidyltransferase domain-containing protein [Bryobacteraceae bacterium]|nr:nucleotidyltransferase domain-containing protein [Bryobacteraceae bacterium]